MNNPETIFRLCSSLALLSWLLLAVLGCKRWVSSLVTGAVIPLLFAIVYSSLLVAHWGENHGSFNTLAGVATLFSNPWLLLAGWVHYLAFDLFIGSWEARDAARLGISHWFVVPCLLLTFFFGPVGLLLYFGLRFLLRRSFAITELKHESPRTY